MRANSAKAREKVDSCGTCQGSFQPQMRRNCASLARASSNCLVRANPYTALATKALAIASRSLDGRPIQPRPQGTKRARGIISKVATRRLAGAVNSPSSSCKRGKSPVCRTSSENRSEEHTSELQSRQYLVCRLLLEKKKNKVESGI